MELPLHMPRPQVTAPLDPAFRPAVLANRAFEEQAEREGEPLILGLEREAGQLSRCETHVFPAGHPRAAENRFYLERLVKFLLWQRGGYRLYVGGSRRLGEYLQACYAPGGTRAFDVDFMGRQVYQQPFTVQPCTPDEVPAQSETGMVLGRHLEGCRVGFDLGASDRKVSAVVDGQTVYSEEVIWAPRQHADPSYHYQEILTAIRSAAVHLPRLDAVGGSSAGIFIDNRPMVASLFRGVPAERYGEVRNLFERLQQELGVPLVVINDGDVTALAGSMALGADGVLGIALGSSEAAGYIDPHGHLLGWLNELAFAPVDYNPAAAVDEWSGDFGCGVQYFSQQAVFRLAPQAGLEIPAGVPDAEKLQWVQAQLESGQAGARAIWETLGVYLGYGLAHYARFYDLQNVLILGRCTSGQGGSLLLESAERVLRAEFPELAGRLHVQLPDERSRRVGQSVAAASLPMLR